MLINAAVVLDPLWSCRGCIGWLRPETVVEVTYAEFTPDGLLRHVVYLGSWRTSLPAT